MQWNSCTALLAQAVSAADKVATEVGKSSKSEFTASQLFGIAIMVLVGSFGLGQLLANALRMKDYAFKIGLILFTLSAGIVVCLLGQYRAGIDLKGGYVLIYQVQGADVDAVVPTIARKINAGESPELKVAANGDRIEVTVPEDQDPAKIRQRVARNASAELQEQNPIETRSGGERVLSYELEKSLRKVDMDNLVASINKRLDPGGIKELTIRPRGDDAIEIIVPDTDPHEVEWIRKRVSTTGVLQFRICAHRRVAAHEKVIQLALASPNRDKVYIGGRLRGQWVRKLENANLPPESVTRGTGKDLEVLMIIDDTEVTGEDLASAQQDIDEKARPCVKFSFGTKGTKLFGSLTRRNAPDPNTGVTRALAILLDNVVQSAPQLQSEIRGSGQITGDFSEDQVKFLIDTLNAGRLQATLNPVPIREELIGEQLGRDTIEKGRTAMIVSTVAVLVFMLMYYRFAGAVADLAVIMNIILAVALMILIKATFTLPGLAGLVLTVGMAVDANVLIYERMREESSKGASLRMTIRNGFQRALTTIIDSNLTTVISAVVLYAIGTSQIKGFAISLILGLAVSMYTAVFVARVIFDVFERQGWLKKLRMMQIIGETKIDFCRYRVPAVIGSLIVIGIGFFAVAARLSGSGTSLWDIDFVGGSSVNVVFSEKLDVGEVRDKIEQLIPGVAVSTVGETGTEFKVDTPIEDIAEVKKRLNQAFAEKLKRYSMNYGSLSPIEATNEATEPRTKTSAAEPRSPWQYGAARMPAVHPAVLGPGSLGADRWTGLLWSAWALGDDPAVNAAEPGDTSPAADPDPLANSNTGAGPAEAPQPETPSRAAEPAGEVAPDAAPAQAAEQPGAAGTDDESAQPNSDASLPTSVDPLVGGTRVKLNFPERLNYDSLRGYLDDAIARSKLQGVIFEISNPEHKPGQRNPWAEWSLEINRDAETTRQLLDDVKSHLESEPVFSAASSIGKKVGDQTKILALIALTVSSLAIILYVWLRFHSLMFGIAAVLALVHDVVVTVGFIAISSYIVPIPGMEALLIDPFKISLTVVAALLTIIGYSVNDTIVIFDRIREVRGKSPELTEKMINDSVNQTLSRTILTSGTVFIGTLILYVMGGQGIHSFAFAMLVGLISGTYSTVYIASPMLLWLRKKHEMPSSRAVAASGAPTASAR